MAGFPRRRRPTPEETVALLAAVGPLVPDAARSQRVRKAVGVTRNVSTIVTTVPFMPLPARVAAGALTGVAMAVDAALRPTTERPAVPSAPPPDDDEILHDPALFAADAASALATGALAAGHALVTGARNPVLRRTIRVTAVAGVIIAVGVVGYRLVVGPALTRRRRRRHDAMALITRPDVPFAPAVAPTAAPDEAEATDPGAAGPPSESSSGLSDGPSAA